MPAAVDTGSKGQEHDVVVIGAGITGVCCATFLRRHGRRVTIVDRLPPGEACSFGNAGSLSPASCVPTPGPGMMFKVPGWLFLDDGPLSIQWRYFPGLVPWLLRYVGAGRAENVVRIADALRALHATTAELYTELAASAGTPDLVRPVDSLFLYGSESSYRSSVYGWDLRRERGIDVRVVSGDEVHDLEPALSRHYVKGVVVPDQAQTLNPSRLVKSIAAQAARDGVAILEDEVRGLEASDGRVTGVRTATGVLAARDVVVAAGAWSTRLTEPLGLKLPLDTERGYHATIEDPGVELTHMLTDGDYKFMATPMEMGLRFAGMVELASVDAPMNPHRADVVVRLAKRMFPGLRAEKMTQWMGCRPSIADGLPVIDRSPRHENLWLAFGHGHTGMIAGPMTGRIIAGLVTGNVPNIDLAPYRADRF